MASEKTEKRKQSLYFPDDMLHEIMNEAVRLDRSLSWMVQQAWRVARKQVMGFPGVDEQLIQQPERQVEKPTPPAPRQKPPEKPGPTTAEPMLTEAELFARGKFDKS